MTRRRVLLADDHPVLIAAIGGLLSKDGRRCIRVRWKGRARHRPPACGQIGVYVMKHRYHAVTH